MTGTLSTYATPAADSETGPDQSVYRVAACACAFVAGTVHAIVVPEHLAQAWYVGVFFAVAFAGQFALALAVRERPGPAFLLGAIAANLGLVVVYVVSRTVGLSFLPAHDHSAHTVEHLPVAGTVGNGVPVFPVSHIEPVGFLDLLCLGAELILVVMLVGMLGGRARQVVVNVMLGVGLLALGARAVGLMA